MPHDYLPILVLAAVAAAVTLLILALACFVGPHNPYPAKLVPYECGIPPLGTARRRFPIKFYLIAMLFIVFDVEVVFFYPWAVALRQLKLLGLLAMLVFVLVLLVGYVYVWRRGAFRWE